MSLLRIKELEAQLARRDERIAVLEQDNHRVLMALKGVMPWVVTQEVACNGLKCREPICMSCSPDSEESARLAQAANAVAAELIKSFFFVDGKSV
jgi:hypothetical protein